MIKINIKNLEALNWWENHYRIDLDIKAGTTNLSSFDIFKKEELIEYLTNFKQIVSEIEDFIEKDVNCEINK